MVEPVIIVHGGAWAIPQENTQKSLDGVKAAVLEGYRVLKEGGSAVDAVVAAVTVMEDDTVFNAGHGALLNKKGEVEMDSIVMEGKDLKAGAVCAVQDIANPVQLARRVMEKTDHCLLVGQGANDFAQEQGVPRLPPQELVTQDARDEWERYMKFSTTVHELFSTRDDVPKLSGCDTVGAVALDINGNLASATSTGGITAKRAGRAGDTPVIGAGAYADNEIGAASSTGHGEAIMRVCLTKRIIDRIERGETTQWATEKALEYMATRVGGAGGAIVINKNGEVAHHFTTSRMAWASIEKGIISHGIDPRETIASNLELPEEEKAQE